MSVELANVLNYANNEYVLVVEDNQDLNLAICEILSSHNYKVKSAINGKEALDIMDEGRPDVILCDIMMPQMDGYTLLKHTRANPHLRSLPFIFLTARTGDEDHREALTIGIEDYLTKPVDEQDLVLAIQNALRRHQIMTEEMQQQLDLLRSQIIGILQHEFRTPLTFVLGYAEYLEDILGQDVETDELHTAIKGILEGGYRLQRLIEGFLLLAELQNRTMNPDAMEKILAVTVVIESIQMMQQALNDAMLEVEFTYPDEDVWLFCEHDLISEAVKRILDNSIRYRRPDSRKIWISIETHDELYICIRIRDEGHGIPAETVEQLSRPFEQPNRADRTEPGAGLSLPMIHLIASLHNGRLEIESTEGVGTICTIWLSAVQGKSL